MSVNDYIAAVRQKNPKIFGAKEIKLTPASLENQIRAAFAAGETHGKNSKSIFEQVFGK